MESTGAWVFQAPYYARFNDKGYNMTIDYDDLERMAGEVKCALSEISEAATGIIALALPTFGDRLITLLDEYDSAVSHLRHHLMHIESVNDLLHNQLAQAEDTISKMDNAIKKLKADLDGERLGLMRIWVRAGCDKKITMIMHYRDWSGERLYDSKVMIESMLEDPNKSVLVPARMDVSEAALTELFIFEDANPDVDDDTVCPGAQCPECHSLNIEASDLFDGLKQLCCRDCGHAVKADESVEA